VKPKLSCSAFGWSSAEVGLPLHPHEAILTFLMKHDVPDILPYPRRHNEQLMALLWRKRSFFMNIRLLPYPSSVFSFLSWTTPVQFLHRSLFP